MADISKIKPNGANGTEYDVKDATARSALENKANNTQTFTEASTRANIASGETMSTLFGKIKKFFTDLKTVAFTGSYNDLSNKPTIPAAVAVKGNAESSYRTGNVNLTAANIGAIALSGTTALAGEITPKTNAAYNLGDLSHAFNYAHFKYLRLMGSNNGIIGTIKNSNDNQITLVMPSRTANPSTGSYYSEENIATREYLNSNLGWEKWYATNITPTSTNTDYTVTAGISSIHEVMVALYYGQVYRQTFVYPAALADGSLIFPDFYLAGSRLYFQMTKVSDTKIRIGSAGSSGSISWSNCQVTLYYR